MLTTKRLFFVSLVLFIFNESFANDKDPFLVPSPWNGRQDWLVADLVTETASRIIVTLKNDQAKRQLQFYKYETAVDKPLQVKDVTVGMEVVAVFGIGGSKKPVYATGTLVGRLRVGQYNVTPNCQVKALPLGVGLVLPRNRVRKIEDNKITSSSSYNKDTTASKARLGNGEVWCPSRKNARGSWLQVDLGLPYYVCSVAVQGNTAKRNEWVKRYTVSLSNDGRTFDDVKENGKIKEFPASRRGIESPLHVALPYRIVRFHARSYHRYPCMGVEIYGYGPVNTISAGQQFNLDELRAVGDPLAPYLLVPYSWKDRKDWRLAKFISQTGNDVQVKITTCPQSPFSFGSTEVIINVPPGPESIHTGRAVYAPFAKDKNGMKMYSVGRVGLVQNQRFLVTPICSKIQKSLPVGVGILSGALLDRINTIPDKQLTATSHLRHHEAKHGRLGNKKVWCAATNQLRTSRFQIDLGSSYFICSIAVQGQLEGKEYWVKSFKMAASIDGRRWSFLRGPTGSDVFHRSGLNAAEISINLATAYRYLSFNPITYYKHACMGVELYGVGPLKDRSSMFSLQDLRIQGSACELQNQCPEETQCMTGTVFGTYTCKCPEGYMSSAGGSAIRPGTDEHCRSINPTGKSIIVQIEKLLRRKTSL